MTRFTKASTLDDVALRLLVDGFQADDIGVLVIAHAARTHAVPEVLVQVMLDVHEPQISRLRAFALIAAQLGSDFTVEQPEDCAAIAVSVPLRELLPA